MAHHVDRVDLLLAAGLLVDLHRRNARHHLLGHLVGGLGPGVDDLVVLLALGDQAVDVLLLELLDEFARGADDLLLGLGDDHVILAEGDTRLVGVVETKPHDAVTEDDRLLLAAVAIDRVDHLGDVALGHQLVAEVVADVDGNRQKLANLHAARRRLDDAGEGLAFRIHLGDAALDLGGERDDARCQSMVDLGHVAEGLALTGLALAHDREIVEAEHDVL